MPETISWSVVSFWKSALVKSGACSSCPFSVSPLPSSPWHLMHFALAKSCFPCGWGAIGAGAGCGDWARIKASASAITISSGTSLSITVEGPFGGIPDGGADIEGSYRLGFSSEGEHERHHVRFAGALD